MPSILPPRLKPQSPEALLQHAERPLLVARSTPRGHFWLLAVRREGSHGWAEPTKPPRSADPRQPNPPCRRPPANQTRPVGGLAETCGWRAFEEGDVAAYGLDLPGGGRGGG